MKFKGTMQGRWLSPQTPGTSLHHHLPNFCSNCSFNLEKIRMDLTMHFVPMYASPTRRQRIQDSFLPCAPQLIVTYLPPLQIHFLLFIWSSDLYMSCSRTKFPGSSLNYLNLFYLLAQNKTLHENRWSFNTLLHLKMLLLHKLAYDLMTQNVTYRLLCLLLIILWILPIILWMCMYSGQKLY